VRRRASKVSGGERRRCGGCEVEEEPVCSPFGYHGQQVAVDGSDGNDATLFFSPAPAELVCSLLLRGMVLVEWYPFGSKRARPRWN
jgi:hypothetical protein